MHWVTGTGVVTIARAHRVVANMSVTY